jgi:hypothetical protein
MSSAYKKLLSLFIPTVFLLSAVACSSSSGTLNEEVATSLTRIDYIKRSSADAAILGDLEAIRYIGPDHSFIIADDIERQIYQLDLVDENVTDIWLDSEFGGYTQGDPDEISPECDLLVDPSTGFCDPEAIAYDPANDELYVFTGNHPGDLTGFLLARSVPGDRFEITGWKRTVQAYTAAIFIDGQFYVAIIDPVTKEGKIAPYDWESDTVGDTIFTNAYEIQDMAYANGVLWLITSDNRLEKVDFAQRQLLDIYDLLTFDINDPRGVEVVGDKLYIGDGDDTRTDDLLHAIHVFQLP